MQSSNTNLTNYGTKAGRSAFFSRYLLLFVTLIFSIYQYSAHRLYGFSVYPDEFGYWASAAQQLGYDWSNVASLGSYYSFGYSLILTPILWFCRDSVSAYRMAVFVNMSLQCISVFLLCGIYRRLCCLANCKAEEAGAKKMQIVLATGVSVFYPAWTFYMQMTLTEALLAFLYVFICYQFVLLLEESKTRNVMIRMVLLSIAFLYLHFVHMRTVGVVAAALLVLICYLWSKPEYRKLLPVAGIVLIIGAVIGLSVKGTVVERVYATAEAENLAANDYSGRLRSLKDILTINGVGQFLQSCVGKLYYLGMSSFGLFYPAIGVCIWRSFGLLYALFRRNAAEKRSATDWFYLFLLLTMLGQFFVSAISMRGSGRLDIIIYGRYNEYFLPVFMGIGVFALLKCRHIWKVFGCSAGISTVLFAVSLKAALQSESTVMRSAFATGLNYLSKSDYSYQVLPEFSKAYAFGLFLLAVVYGSIRLGGYLKQNIIGTAAVLLMELLLTICLCRKYTWTYSDYDYYDLKVCEYIEEYRIENADMPVWYLYGGGTTYIDLIQFAMRAQKIEILWEKDMPAIGNVGKIPASVLPEEGFLIADRESPYLEELENQYQKCVESNSFVLFLAK